MSEASAQGCIRRLARPLAAAVLAAAAAGCRPGDRGPSPAAPAARGEAAITAVRGDLAAINRGAVDGIRRGMELIVWRGKTFIARLRIAEVGTATAAGILMDRKLAPRVGDRVVDAAPAPPPGPAPREGSQLDALGELHGTVTAVRGDVAGVDVGSADGARPGMVLVVYRGDDFVAHLRLAEVGASSSAGVLYDAARAPTVGDRVTALNP